MAANPKNGDGAYHVLDFQNLNEKGLAGLVSAIKQAGKEIAEVIPSGPARKKDGVSIKQFSLIDMAGQNMTFTVTETGDISSVTLNGKPFPETHPTSLKDLAGKIAAGLEKTEEAFQASLARKVAKQARLDADKEARKDKKVAVKTQGQRLVEATVRLKTATDLAEEYSREVSQRQTTNDATAVQVAQLQAQLTTETQLTQTLKQQIAELKGAA